MHTTLRQALLLAVAAPLTQCDVLPLTCFTYFGDGFLRVEQKQAVHVVGHAVNDADRTTEVFQLLARVLMNLVFYGFVQEKQPLLGRPDRVYPDFVERMGHFVVDFVSRVPCVLNRWEVIQKV